MSEHIAPPYRESPMDCYGTTTDRTLPSSKAYAPGQLSPSLPSWAAPAGFEPYHIARMAPQPQVLYRNWRRQDKPSLRQHVLVVDDDPLFLAIVGQLLDDEGYSVTLSDTPVTDGQVRRLRPDAVIADAAFNGGGDRVAQIAGRGAPDGAIVPVIYTTIAPPVAERLSRTDTPVLLKPFDLDELLEVLKTATR